MNVNLSGGAALDGAASLFLKWRPVAPAR